MTYSGQVDIRQVIDEIAFRVSLASCVLGFAVSAIDGFDTAAMGYVRTASWWEYINRIWGVVLVRRCWELSARP